MRKKWPFLFALVSLVLWCNSSFALDRSQKWGLGLDLGASVPLAPSAFRGLADPLVAAGAHVRYHADSFWGLGLSYDRLEFSDTSLAANALNLGAFARLFCKNDITPWLFVGIGPDHVSHYAGASSYWRFGAKAEAGIEYDFTDSVSLGAKLAYFFVTKNENTLHALAPSISATWYVGTSQTATPEPKRMAEAPVAQPDTFTQAIASKSGIKLNVEFDPGRADIKSGHSDELQNVAQYLKQHTNTKLTLEGHTDSSGNLKNNTTLSQQRAEAVRNELIEKFGIEATRLNAIGYGPTRPIATNKTKDGRARNRRVMAVITSE